MPPIRLLISIYHALLISFIAYDGEIISPCFYYAKKGLVYIAIVKSSSRQPFFCSECTKLNIYILYNLRSVSLNKYIYFACFASL